MQNAYLSLIEVEGGLYCKKQIYGPSAKHEGQEIQAEKTRIRNLQYGLRKQG